MIRDDDALPRGVVPPGASAVTHSDDAVYYLGPLRSVNTSSRDAHLTTTVRHSLDVYQRRRLSLQSSQSALERFSFIGSDRCSIRGYIVLVEP